ncbi:endogenous retrovirus group K member 10 Gag polyprotein-like [Grus japonensis]|uniref:Endogenous retrovirus group K member 10 Gag polyprotein-like n=1 Tax=Grus japonensis TaxID=30415 RepID=A0ABC9WS00_GRUJA
MGQSATREQKLHTENLQRILQEQGFKVAPLQLVRLLVWIRDYCPWFPVKGSYDLTQWQKVGEELQTKQLLQLELPDGILITWRVVYTALRTLLPAEQVLQKVNDSVLPPTETNTRKESRSFELIDPELEPDNAEVAAEPPLSEGGADPGDPFDPGPVDPERELDLYPLLTPVKAMAASAPTAEEILQQQRQKTLSWLSLMHPPPFAPPPPSYQLQGTVHSKISGGLLDECRTEALKRGDISLLQDMPVLYRLNRPPEYAHLPYDVIKEVRKSIKEYGLQASFTMNLLQVIGESYVLTPLDWKSILRLVLSAAQYSVWFSEYRELVQAQVMDNLTAGTAIGLDELMGEGNYATGAAKAGLSRNVFTQAAGLALRALRRVPDFGKWESSFASIRQGPQEPYVQFLDRLQTAIQRQIESSEAAELLLFQLAIENANMDCRRAIDPIRNQAKTLNDLIRACQNMGSEQHKADMLAAALAQQLILWSAIRQVQKAEARVMATLLLNGVVINKKGGDVENNALANKDDMGNVQLRPVR